MGVYPKIYTKDSFIKFLRKNGMTNGVIGRLERLPEVLNVNNQDYKLNIQSSWYSGGDTHYEFEFNYYSEEIMEFLLSYKVFNDIEVSLNYLERELHKKNFIDFDPDCSM